tara:strand:+ start:3861 stop:4229 length:369 start_codon:yes stop_codon:yes gene_type:complete
MKMRLFIILASLPLLLKGYDFIEISHTAASQNVGKLRTVCGKVQSTYINPNTASQRIYLNMGGKYPNHTFTGLIWYSSNKDNFNGRPDKKYKKRNICISGVITTFNSKPQIQIDFENQIEIR